MHCTEHHAIRVRLLQPLAAAALIVSGLIMTPAANAQMSPPQARPEQQSPQAPSASLTISDEKLNAAAAAIGRVTSIRQSHRNPLALTKCEWDERTGSR